MVEGADAAGSGAEHAEAIRQHKSGQAVDAHRVGARTGLDAGSAVLTTGGVGADLGADARDAERVSRWARGAEVGGAAGDAGEDTVGASIIGGVEVGSSEAGSAVVGLVDHTIHAVGAAGSAHTEFGVAGTCRHEVKSRDADRT